MVAAEDNLTSDSQADMIHSVISSGKLVRILTETLRDRINKKNIITINLTTKKVNLNFSGEDVEPYVFRHQDGEMIQSMIDLFYEDIFKSEGLTIVMKYDQNEKRFKFL